MIDRIKTYLEQRKHKNILIHIGKCGGTSLKQAIKESEKLKITKVVHVDKPIFIQNKNYYIVARDPISRCISSFNWRYKLVVTDQIQKHRFKGEYDVLKKYQILNHLVEKLYDKEGNLNSEIAAEFETIHHLRERISYYLKEFLKDCQPSMIKGVFMQESLNADIDKYLDVNNHGKPAEKLTIQAKGRA